MSCCFIKLPKITLVYIYPMGGAGVFRQNAEAWLESYRRNPSGMEHDTLIVCNGVPPTEEARSLFSISNATFLHHDNTGWDIGGFQAAARQSSASLMVFCGSSSYFRGPGWLARIYESFTQFGDTLYGAMGVNASRPGLWPHVRTTGFWCSPALFNSYPHLISQTGAGGQRYDFEHGQNSITNWVKSRGGQVWIVGWDSVYPLDDCDAMRGGYQRDNQENLLVGDRLSRPPFYHCS
jgi:hypothetical protein